MQNQAAPRRQTIRPGSDFYYALRFAPVNKRTAISALHGVCTEISEVIQECSDAGVARLKLQWWHDEIGQTWQDNPQHPATKDLHPYLPEYNLAEEYFQEFIDGNLMELDQTGYAAFSELALYCHRVSGTTQSMIAEILGYTDRRTPRYATDLGIALKLIDLIPSLRQSLLQGRSYLPRDEIQKFNVDPECLLRGEHTSHLAGLLAHQSERAQELLQRAKERLPECDQSAQTFGLILAEIAAVRLTEVQKDDFRVLDHRIELTPIRKLWIAWKTARQYRR